jgi:hypothetical protein
VLLYRLWATGEVYEPLRNSNRAMLFGFIANLNDPDDIDSVFYVVAHEMAHQRWAHQVIGADMEIPHA